MLCDLGKGSLTNRQVLGGADRLGSVSRIELGQSNPGLFDAMLAGKVVVGTYTMRGTIKTMKRDSNFHSVTVEAASEQPEYEGGSFVGGYPRLPPATQIPSCVLCNAPQTFFMQFEFPLDHLWSGSDLAIFACTSCANENYLIPRMLDQPLQGVSVPVGFLEEYQRNFRLVVFPTMQGKLRTDYSRKVAFRRLRLGATEDVSVARSRVGGTPFWILGDETPSRYADAVDLQFLLQWQGDYLFETLPGAPPQVELGLDGNPTNSPEHGYRLFIGNEIYLFGTVPPAHPRVYLLTQCD